MPCSFASCACRMKEVMHVGASYSVSVLRVICLAQTAVDLVKAGSFRLDPYFRLAGVCRPVAPLRDRLKTCRSHRQRPQTVHGKNASVITPGHSGYHPALFLARTSTELANVGHEPLLSCFRGQQFNLACFGEEIFRHRNQFFDKAPQRDAGGTACRVPADCPQGEVRRCAGDQKSGQGFGISYSSLRRVLEADAAQKDVIR